MSSDVTVHGSYSAGGTTGIGVARTGKRAEKVQFIPHGTDLLFPRGGGFEIQSLEGRAAVPFKTTMKVNRFPTSATVTARNDRYGRDETALGNRLPRMSKVRHHACSWVPNSSVVYREILSGFAESRIVLHESHGRLLLYPASRSWGVKPIVAHRWRDATPRRWLNRYQHWLRSARNMPKYRKLSVRISLTIFCVLL